MRNWDAESVIMLVFVSTIPLLVLFGIVLALVGS